LPKYLQLQGALPPDPPTRGSAPGPRWEHCPDPHSFLPDILAIIAALVSCSHNADVPAVYCAMDVNLSHISKGIILFVLKGGAD